MKPYYQEAGVTIYCGDSREILPALKFSSAVAVTDPPYGIAHESGWKSSWEGNQIRGDENTAARDTVLTLLEELPAAVFGSWKQPRPVSTRAVLIWDKGAAFGMGDLRFPWKNSFEEIYIIGQGWRHERRDEGVIRGYWVPFAEGQGRRHQNEKPVSLLAYLILHHPAPLVIDPFMGIGSTLRAAKDVGCQAIGIEVEERYCEIAAERLLQEALPLAWDVPAVEPEQVALFAPEAV